MGERTQYAPGTFSWADLSTTDQDAARAFYGALFGWEADDMPVGEGVVYSMMRVGDRQVAAISPQPQAQREAGVPPLWNSYVTVASADDAAARAQELGAAVPAPPFDVMDVGRMAVIRDPQGAFFMVWEPKRHIGAGLVNAPGALVWNELASNDLDDSSAFYSGLFGWTIAPFEGSEQLYLSIRNGDANNGGMREATPPGVPPHWLVYFGVDDLAAALERVGELGGTVHAGPIDIQMAKIAIVADPQGATFALYDGMMEP
ncbi:MAG TPA: VOC family protein [Conexibacter sp.]|jgi:predicted enzyme related to lactoylglutathione lyase|nr:VOC family protein [Conexibacter sp.]